jgi:coenzyme F420-reducing hydrogenase beta subunit
VEIIVYGAGKWANENLQQIVLISDYKAAPLLEKVVCFADGDVDKHGGSLFDLPITDIKTALAKYPDACIFVALGERIRLIIANFLVEEISIPKERIINFGTSKSPKQFIVYGIDEIDDYWFERVIFADEQNNFCSLLDCCITFADDTKIGRIIDGKPVISIQTALIRFPDAYIFLADNDNEIKKKMTEKLKLLNIDKSRILSSAVPPFITPELALELELKELKERKELDLSVFRKIAELIDDESGSVFDYNDENPYLRRLLKRGLAYDFISDYDTGYASDTAVVYDSNISEQVLSTASLAKKQIILIADNCDDSEVDKLICRFRESDFIVTSCDFCESTPILCFKKTSVSNLINSSLCNGCGACICTCETGALTFGENEKGFYRPLFDASKCVNCGICLSICPAQNKSAETLVSPPSHAFSSDNKTRLKSASGGAFAVLAEHFIKNGGKVAGAAFQKDLTVKFAIVDCLEDLPQILKSKYVQSLTGDIYKKIKCELDKGTEILIGALPCQIAGLNAYLQKDYDNLYTCDLLCHGAPSPKIHKKFVDDISQGKTCNNITWRYKDDSRKNQSYIDCFVGRISLSYNEGANEIVDYKDSDYYYLYGGFNGEHYMIDKCCEYCRFSSFPRPADITVGDLHDVGITYKVSFDYKYGCSVIFPNNAKGDKLTDILKNDPRKLGFETVPFEWSKDNEIKRHHKLSDNHERLFELAEKMPLSKAADIAINRKYDVALVSLPNTPNFGASLNPYAIYKAIRNLGKDVVMVLNPEIFGQGWLTPYPQSFRVNPFREYDFFRSQNMAQMCELNNKAKCFLLGSDQLLREANRIGSGKYTDLLWVTDNIKKSAYGVSYGESIFTETEQTRAEMHFFLSRFNYLSVREQSAVPILEENFDLHPDCVIDPVFLLPREEFDILADRGNDLDCDGILSYVLDDEETGFKTKILNRVKDETRLTSVSVYERLGDTIKEQRIFCEDFLAAIRRCKMVVTDSFHGVCFSIIYNKPFIALANAKRGLTRFECILNLAGLEKKLCLSEADYETAMQTEIDWDSVKAKLKPVIEHSLDCLKKAIEPCDMKKPFSAFDVIYQEQLKNR